MGKELTPLEALGRIIQYNDLRNPVRGQTHLIDIIETALKNNEHLEKEICFVKTMEDLTIEAMKDKKLKALEIIKERKVDIHNLLNSKTVEQYNGYAHWLGFNGNLTPKEYNLLREVLYYDTKRIS